MSALPPNKINASWAQQTRSWEEYLIITKERLLLAQTYYFSRGILRRGIFSIVIEKEEV